MDASLELREIGGLFTIEAGVRPGVDPAKVERAIDEELARFLAGGPTPVELQRVKTQTRAGFIRGVERIGGFGGKSDVLAKGEVFAGRPDFYKVQLQRIARRHRRRRCAARRRAGSRDGVYTLEVAALPRLQPSRRPARTAAKLPEPGTPPKAEFPAARARHAVERAQDRAGRAARRSRRCSFDLLLDAGFAADQFAQPGTASLAMTHAGRGHHDAGPRSRSATGSPTSAPRWARARGSTSRACRSRRCASSSTRRSSSTPT